MIGRSPGSQAGGWGVGPQRLPHGWGVIPIKLFPTQHGSGYFLGRRWRTGLNVTCVVASQLAESTGLSWEAVASLQQLLPAHYPEHSLPGWILAIAPSAAAAEPSCNARGRVCFAFAKNYCAMEGSM